MTDIVTKQVPVEDLKYLHEILTECKTPRVIFTGDIEGMRASAENSRLITINDAIGILEGALRK